ncbi:MAG: hypothetical protein K2X94_00660 [Amoebophilaceae bacterium]|nr:hypothetical protein [Amoebophilaceae bacterium]
MEALINNRVAIALYLLDDFKYDYTMNTADGSNIFHLAFKTKNDDLVQKLVDRMETQAVKLFLIAQDNQGKSPLDYLSESFDENNTCKHAEAIAAITGIIGHKIIHNDGSSIEEPITKEEMLSQLMALSA